MPASANETSPAKRTRRPRDPNKVIEPRPVYVVFKRDDEAKGGVNILTATRSAAAALDAMESVEGASYQKVLVQGR